MAKEELVEGIRLALAKGSTLREAMMSFYNSGYSREDIEEAARAVQIPQFSQLTGTPETLKPLPRSGVQPKTAHPVHVAQQVQQKPTAQTKANTQRYQALTPNSTQKISNYNFTKKKKKNMIAIVIILILLVVALALIFLFRSQLTTLFHNLIG